jgi:ketosteroid isomerase-like protein
MISKNGFNIMLFVIIMISFSIISCQKKAIYIQTGSLIQTDKKFSAMSEKEGMFKAFLFYIADDGVILRNNSYPSKGKSSLNDYFEGKSDTSFVLTWEPLFEKMAESGDLGYTYGTYKDSIKSTGKVQKGTYVSIWQKQKGGNWKLLLDTGTQGLPETAK